MAGWEEELASLLHELGVKQEESPSGPGGDALPPLPPSTNTTFRPKRRFTSRISKLHELHEGHTRRQEQSKENDKEFDELLPRGLQRRIKETSTPDSREDDPWIHDAATMRREIDAIVKQVVRQMQSGNLAPALKDDIMIVLRALRRRALASQQSATNDEAYLESAGAMLHFCRLVLQLNEQDIRDF